MNFFEHPPHRILLIKPSSMGDVIHALPIVAELHRAWPQAEIRWLIHPAWNDLVQTHPAVAQTIPFPRDQFRGILGGVRSLRWALTLHEWRPDLVVDLQGLLRSGLIARCTGARHVVGLSDAREGATFFYTAIATVDSMSHAVTRYSQVLKTLGLLSNDAPWVPQFDLPLGKEPAGFLLNHPFVVIHPYARGEEKNLTQEQVIAFASSLKGLPVVLVGQGKKMEGLPANVHDWSGRTNLLELIGILRRAAFVVSSDSGPMHLAAALQPDRIIAIHRWSDPFRVGPWPAKALVWKNGEIQSHEQLTEKFRLPGRAPSCEEMNTLADIVLKLL